MHVYPLNEEKSGDEEGNEAYNNGCRRSHGHGAGGGDFGLEGLSGGDEGGCSATVAVYFNDQGA